MGVRGRRPIGSTSLTILECLGRHCTDTVVICKLGFEQPHKHSFADTVIGFTDEVWSLRSFRVYSVRALSFSQHPHLRGGPPSD